MGQAEQNGLLRPEFINGIIKLKQFIVDNTPSKMNVSNNGVSRPIKGNVLANLIEQYVTEINKSAHDGGVIPDIVSAWDNLVQTQIYSAYIKCMTSINIQIKAIVLPMEVCGIILYMDRIKQKCLKQFTRVRDLISEDNDLENATIDQKSEELERYMDAEFKKVMQKNCQISF